GAHWWHVGDRGGNRWFGRRADVPTLRGGGDSGGPAGTGGNGLVCRWREPTHAKLSQQGRAQAPAEIRASRGSRRAIGNAERSPGEHRRLSRAAAITFPAAAWWVTRGTL